MSKQVKKVPLNLKLLQKNQEQQSESAAISQRESATNPHDTSTNSNHPQFNERYELEQNEEESPFILKCKENTTEKANNQVKPPILSQSSFFPSSMRQSILSQNSDTPNNSNSTNPPKQRFIRRYFQQNQGQGQQANNGRNFTQLEINKEKIDYIQQVSKRSFNSQFNLSNQKDKNPFSNNIIANIVENSSVQWNKKIKQKYVQKLNPSYKLDEQFIQAMNSFKKDLPNGISDEQVIASFKSQESLEGNITNTHKLNHIHRNYKIISRTYNDLDNCNQTQFNGFQNQPNYVPNNFYNDQITEMEQKNLIDLYHKNVKNTMTECCPSNNQLNYDSSDSPQIRSSQFEQQEMKPTLFKLKSEGFINDHVIFEVQQSQESATQCSTPPQQNQQITELEYSQEKYPENIKERTTIEQSIKIKSSENVARANQNLQLKSLSQKQYQVKFTDINNIKNSTQEYSNIFKNEKQQQFTSSNSLKDQDEKYTIHQSEKVPIFRIKQNVKNEKQISPFEMQKNQKGKEKLFSCSYQNIEKILQNNDEDQDDFELYNYLSCNIIPDQVNSNNNLDIATSEDIQQKNFILRTLKGADDFNRTGYNKFNKNQNSNFKKRASSQQGMRKKIQFKEELQQLREPVK